MIATSVRPTATAVPFSVCTGRGDFAPSGAIAAAQAARLVVGRVRARRELAVAALARQPRLAGRTSSPRTRQGRPQRCSRPGTGSRAPAGSPPGSRGCARAPRPSRSGWTNENISTLSNWWTRKIPRVSLPGGPRLAAKAGREARVAQREVLLREQDLVGVERGEADLRGPDQEEVVAGDLVDLSAVGRQEAGPEERLLPHQHGRRHRGEPLPAELVEARTARARARPAPARP